MPDMLRGHLLESLDPVRSGTPSVGVADEGLATEQALSEALLAVALGRTVVVSQSVALDSRAFLALAQLLESARPGPRRAAVPPPAVRLHVVHPTARTLDEVLKDLLVRATGGERPFVSSSMPWLSDCSAEELGEMAGDLDLLHARMDDDHSEQLALVRSVYGTGTRWRATPRRARPLAAAFGALAAVEGDRGAPPVERDVAGRATAALRALGPEVTTLLRNRSRLRSRRPWPTDADGRSPLEVVGDAEDLALVVEVVDTLYNRAVADSVGPVPTTWSTGLEQDPLRVVARRVAQACVLHPHGSAPGSIRADLSTDPPADPQFQVLAEGGPATRDHLVRALRDGYEQAFARLLQARAEPGVGGAPNPFWRSAEALDVALSGRDPSRARHALDAHAQQVAQVLGGAATVEPGPQGVQLLLRVARGGGATAGLEVALSTLASWDLPGLGTAGALVLGALGEPAVSTAKDAHSRWRRRRQLVSALGEVLVLDESA